MDTEGNIYVTDGESERLIGSYPEGAPDNPFELYERRYSDLEATIRLFEDRLPHLGARDIDQTVATLREAVAEPAAIGDLPALRERVDKAAQAGEERKVQAKAERQAAREQAIADRSKSSTRTNRAYGSCRTTP